MSKNNGDGYTTLGDISPIEKLASEQLSNYEKKELKNLKDFDRVAFNSLAEERFLDFVHDLIRSEGGEVTKTLILKESSFELDISTETVKRYLLKHTARRATLFETDEGKIRSKKFRQIR